MNNLPADSKEATTGFWKRLGLAIVTACEPYEEQLERRVSRLEAELTRLADVRKMSSRHDDPESEASSDSTQRR